ncbi:hypothetical protein EXIGLDRAFT_707419 [Exidia glandulosa HHB12029]|uniref:DUF6533 domain-containing protein n=1 Tax=Exidia glandulosa HHB12029 TaxID=1314781 RepID=A0A166NJR7_EXIGL|nr:hypothetical protein EXIGLDRAFT_707419 [Exidia glandulosa HHB12029]
MTVMYPITYVKVTAWTWYHYDTLLTLSDEVDLIWQRGWSWSWSVGLFFLIRLIAMSLLNASVATISARIETRSGCRTFDNVVAGGTFLLAFSICIMLQMRVHAMYMRNRRIVWLNALLFALVVAAAGITIAVNFHKQELTPGSQIKELSGICFVHNGPAVAAAFCLREAGTLMSLLVGGSVAYFIFLTCGRIFSASTVVVTLWMITPTGNVVALFHAAAGIGGTRLTLSLRKEVLGQADYMNTLGSTGQYRWELAERTGITGTRTTAPAPSIAATSTDDGVRMQVEIKTWPDERTPGTNSLADGVGDLRTVGSV